MHQEIQHLITTLLDMSAATSPSVWLMVCKSVVTASKHADLEEDEALSSKPLAQPTKQASDKVNADDEDEDRTPRTRDLESGGMRDFESGGSGGHELGRMHSSDGARPRGVLEDDGEAREVPVGVRG